MPASVDQAAGLRQAAAQQSLSARRGVCCVAVASGKGGVGKTFVSTSLAVACHQLGKRVLLVDADLGLANADILLGVTPNLTLQDAIFRGRSLADVVTRSPYGVDLLAASSGSREMVSLGEARIGLVIDELLAFASGYDVLLFDCASGIDGTVLSFLQVAPQGVIVATGQPTSIMDVYALVKVVHQRALSDNLSVVVNMVGSDSEGRQVFETLARVTRKFLSRSMSLAGIIPESRDVAAAVRRRRPLGAIQPDHPVARRIREIARRIVQGDAARTAIGRLDGTALVHGLLGLGQSEGGS